MKWKEIQKAFTDQWVLIQVEKVDEFFKVVEGQVLAHSKDKDEVYQRLLQIRPKEFAIEYTGLIPENLAVVLVSTN
jgi:aminopeptidase C